MRHLHSLLFLLLAAVLPAQHDMLGVTFTGQSVAFDSRAGRAQLLTTNTITGQNAMARVGNVLFSTDRVATGIQTFTFGLGQVSPVSGAYTRTHQNVGDLRGLAAHPTNPALLFGIVQNDPDLLVTVNTATGAVTTIGSTGTSGIQALTLYQGQLLAWDIIVGLMRVDMNTGHATDVNPSQTGSNQIQWLSEHSDGRLLGGSTLLAEIDPATGAVSAIAQLTGFDVRGAEERMPILESFGTGCNTAQHVPAVLTAAGGSGPNTALALQSTLHEPNHFGALVIGFVHHTTPALTLPLALGPLLGTSGCTLFQTLDLVDYGFTDGTGRLAETFTLPAFMAGATFFAQHAVFETVPGGMSWSNSIMVKVGF